MDIAVYRTTGMCERLRERYGRLRTSAKYICACLTIIFVRTSVHYFVRQAVRPSVRPFPSYLQSVCLPFRPSKDDSVRPSVRLSVRPTVRPFVSPSFRSYVHLSVLPTSVRPLSFLHSSVGPSVHSSVHPSVRSPVISFVRPPVSPSVLPSGLHLWRPDVRQLSHC